MHCLYFICERKFYALAYVKITRHWKSTLRVIKPNSRFAFVFCRLWTNMSDKDFEVLQTALSPEVSESEEQVCPYCYCILNIQVFKFIYIVIPEG